VDLVVAPSPGLKHILESVGVTSHIEVVPNGVDLAPYRGDVQPVDRDIFGFSTDDVVLVYAGRLGPEKNLPFLLRAFNGVAQSYDHARLLIVGDGPERDNLVDRVQHMGISSLVKFTGMVEYTEIPRYLAASDAFVTASISEVHPLSVIEAMASGLSILGIDSPGIGDTIKDGETGFIVRDEELAAFTAKMVRLITDHELRHQMGVQAREVSKEYAIERTTEIMLNHYRWLIAKSKDRKTSIKARFYQFVDKIRR
jgi:1,2-diacylglycerol 3-alpha-glucosyltransferase